VTSLSRLNPVTQQIETCEPGEGNFPVTIGEGYFIEVDGDAELLIYDDQPCVVVDLSPGINLIGYAGPNADLTSWKWLGELGVDFVSSICRHDSESDRFQTCAYDGDTKPSNLTGEDFSIWRGEGYLLNVRSGFGLEFGDCLGSRPPVELSE
jgi:hypothetical protein